MVLLLISAQSHLQQPGHGGEPPQAPRSLRRRSVAARARTLLLSLSTLLLAASAGDPLWPAAAAPVVYNASSEARAGDIVGLQGANFGNAPTVVLTSAPQAPLEIVNSVADGANGSWLAVRIPPDAAGALTLRIRNNDAGASTTITLNRALPLHLDALQLVPGGLFRIVGRNLLLPGATPVVTIDGKAVQVDLAASSEHVLLARVPARLTADASARLTVDNGNGSGAAVLDRAIDVATADAGMADVFGLGVSWAAAFGRIAGRVVDAAADARLGSDRARCDGEHDDTPSIQRAIDFAAGNGGGVVQLPAGRCALAGSLQLRSRVVLQGAGKAATELRYGGNYPVRGEHVDLAGVRDLTLTNTGASQEGPLLKESTRVLLQNVAVNLGTSRQMYLDGNRNIAVVGCDFVQAGSISEQGPYVFNGSAGLVFSNNTTRWTAGAPAFARSHDAVIANNRFTRDAGSQQTGGVVHGVVLDFAHRVAVVANTFDMVGGPVTAPLRNDGEAVLAEGGGADRTENMGSVAGATATTLSDAANRINADPFGSGSLPENYGIAIVAGRGAGQTRRVVAYSAPVLTVDRAWSTVPDASSRYATFVWGLEKALIEGNVFSQQPRGIWLYHSAMRDVAVVGNSFTEGGGIYLRAYQSLAVKRFMPIYNVLIAKNRVVNTSGRWMSYINAVFVNADTTDFGIAMLGIEMRDNQITANRPNVSSQTEEYASIEGLMSMMRVENAATAHDAGPQPGPVLGTLISGNACLRCDVAVRVGAGAVGATISGTRVDAGTAPWSDLAGAGGERSARTVVH